MLMSFLALVLLLSVLPLLILLMLGVLVLRYCCSYSFLHVLLVVSVLVDAASHAVGGISCCGVVGIGYIAGSVVLGAVIGIFFAVIGV